MFTVERLKTLIILLQFALVAWLGVELWNADYMRFMYSQAFEEVRADNEALYRTKGYRINPAYRCYHKTRYLGRINKGDE